MLRKAYAIAFFCLIPFASTDAQTITIQRPAGAVDPNAGPIRVQISVNFFVPGPTDESEQSVALRDRASRTIYALAARECEVAATLPRTFVATRSRRGRRRSGKRNS